MSGNIRILLVEDNPVDALLIKEILNRGKVPFELTRVETLEASINKLENHSHEIDVILLDLTLPDSEGLDTFYRIQELTPHIPIVILTNINDEQVGVMAMRDGAQDYLIKGQVDGRLLIRAVRYSIERKQVQDALRESEARYRSFITQSSEGIARWEIIPPMPLTIDKNEWANYIWTHAYVAECNDAFARRWGLANAQCATGQLLDEIMGDDSTNHELIDHFVQANFHLQNAEFKHVKNEDEVYFYRNTLTGFLDDNCLVRIWALKQDITERKKTEEALRSSEAQLKEAQSVAHVGSWTIDLRNENHTWSDEMFRIYRIDPSKGIPSYSDLKKYIFPRDWEKFDQLIHETIELGSGSELEVAIMHPDGLKHTLLMRWRVLRDENGEAISLVGTSQDITDRKSAEKELHIYREYLEEQIALRTNELKDSEERYRTLAQNITDVIWTMDLSGKILYVSPSSFKQTGYSPDDLLETEWQQLLTPESLNRLMDALSVAREEYQKGKQIQSAHLELEFICKDKAETWMEMSYSAMNKPNGEFSCLIGTSRNITERVKLIHELQNAKEAAESATKAKSEFLANMSHEIRTPMNAIIGFADLLYFSINEDKPKSQLDTIRSSARNLLGIINDILDLSKIEAGKLSLEYGPVNIRHMAREIESIFIQRISDKGLQFEVNYPINIPNAIILDEVRLRQVLFNLIGNAVKFTEKGGVKLQFEVNSGKTDSQINLKIKVIDSGIGIREEQQLAIFEAFNQQVGQSTKKYGGTGLGLTITKRLVEMMGGTISVSSKTGHGATFEICVPDVEVTDKEGRKRNDEIFDPSAIVFDRALVLVCDDNITDRKLIVQLIEQYQLSTIEAVNGVEAVEMALRYRPNLILLDKKMPLLDGIEALAKLRENTQTASIPVVMISASSRLVLDKNLQSNIDGYLIKPFGMYELVEAMKQVLPHKILIQEKAISQTEILSIEPELGHGRLSELIKVLNDELLPIYNEVTSTQNISNIEVFGKRITEVAELFQVSVLAKYGNEIYSFAEKFEIDKLMSALKLFPEIIERYGKMKDDK